MEYLNKYAEYAAAVLNLQYFIEVMVTTCLSDFVWGEYVLKWNCIIQHILGTVKICSLQEWFYKYVYINTK